MSKPQPILNLPLCLVPFIKLQVYYGITSEETAAIEQHNLTEQNRIIAQQAMKEWTAVLPTGKKEQVGNRIIWRTPTEETKDAIKQDPMTALQSYLKGPTWWTPDEILETVRTDPTAAFWAAKKCNLGPEKLVSLQHSVGRTHPELLYHMLSIPGTNVTMALQQCRHNPYWTMMIQKQKENSTTADQELEAAVNQHPEAASFVVFRQIDEPNEELIRMAMATLECHPEWAYRTALRLTTKPDEDDWRWEALRTIALRSPKWAFHWIRDFAPDNATSSAAEVWNHPGWAAEMLKHIAATQGPDSARQFHQKVYLRNNKVFTGINTWHLAYLIWASTEMKPILDTTTETTT